MSGKGERVDRRVPGLEEGLFGRDAQQNVTAFVWIAAASTVTNRVSSAERELSCIVNINRRRIGGRGDGKSRREARYQIVSLGA